MMTQRRRALWCVALVWLLVTASHAQATGTLLETGFEGANPWPGLTATASQAAVTARVAATPVGTVDVAGSSQPSGGLLLAVDSTKAAGPWRATLVSGELPVTNAETDLGKLTLAFSAAVSTGRPIRIQVDSFDAAHRHSGGLEELVHPAAPGFYQRYAVDLSAMASAGPGRFQPTDPFVQFSFELSSSAGWPAAAHELRLDNVHYAGPAWYVAPAGDDAKDGRTPATAFATPQKALDVAQAGDTILLMDGRYEGRAGTAAFRRAGRPSAWITLKNYPGHRPVLLPVASWACLSIVGPRQKADTPGLAYLEVRGLHIRGDADVAKAKYRDAMGQSDPRTNCNGIFADGRPSSNKPHHLRFADNTVELCAGAGIAYCEADWVTTEHNTIRDNAWWTIYACSGISYLGTWNYDALDGDYKGLIRNNWVSGNQCFVMWKQLGRFSDGNGIIIDTNHVPAQNKSYLGRTLVQNNLCFNNGGSGIHAFQSHRVDIVNNTAWMNSASPDLQYAQIFAQDADDVRILNNILVAPVAKVEAGDKPESINGAGRSTHVVYSGNLYFGGNRPPLMGVGDQIADPLFVRPSTDPTVADFRLQPGSPARGSGVDQPFVPRRDLDGRVRTARPDCGAYEGAP